MNKFTRVSETIPDSIAEALGAGNKIPELDSDPYAQLKATAESRRAAIMREVMRSGERQKKVVEETDWQQANAPATYRGYAEAKPEEISNRGIRRTSSADDDGENARDLSMYASFQNNPTPLLTSKEEAEDYLRRASIWNPDIDILQAEVADICNESMLENNRASEMQTRRERLAEARKSKHSNWESEQMNRIQDTKVLSNSGRSNILLGQRAPLLCTSTENVVASKFGIPDWQSALERDQRRAKIAEDRMAESKAIKRQGHDPQDEWDANSVYTPTYQTHKSDWLDKHLNDMVK